MKKIFVVLTVCVLLAGSIASAQDASNQALAEELLGLMDVQANIEKSFDAVKQMQSAQLQSLAGDKKDEAIAMQEKIMNLISSEMSWDKIKADYISIYAETFTADELQGIIDFYKTPVGKKFIEKQPEMMQKSMQITQKQMMHLMPKIQAMTLEAAGMQKPMPVSAEGNIFIQPTE